jgi:hypothetical protein
MEGPSLDLSMGVRVPSLILSTTPLFLFTVSLDTIFYRSFPLTPRQPLDRPRRQQPHSLYQQPHLFPQFTLVRAMPPWFEHRAPRLLRHLHANRPQFRVGA